MALDPLDQPHGGNDRQLVIYTNAGFFDEQLNSLDPAAVNPARPVILAVSDQMPISRIIGFKRDYPGLKVEIAELTPDWQARINGMGRETGQ